MEARLITVLLIKNNFRPDYAGTIPLRKAAGEMLSENKQNG